MLKLLKRDMKKSKTTKSNQIYKILRMISRDEQFERNGGGQFVSMNRAYKDKSKYNRNDKKKELRNDLNSFLFNVRICLYVRSQMLSHKSFLF
jgi:hypothetical protein